MKRLTGLLLALLLPAGRAGAQPEARPPRATASVELSLFNLDVVVTDADGRPVHGLKAEDFEVTHGGRRVTITNFGEVRAEEPPPGPGVAAVPSTPAAPAAAPRPPRRIVVFFDRLQIPEPDRRAELFGSIRRLLGEALGEGDEAMVVTWNRSIRTVMPFTDDPDRIEETLQAVERFSRGIPTEKADLEILQAEDAWFTSLAADPRIGTDFGGFAPSATLGAQQAFFEMKSKTAALAGLAATLGGMEGRKVLVLVSHRFSRFAGLEFFLRPRAGIESTAETRNREFDTKRLLEEVARTANANGVTLYAVFPAGMDGPLPSAADPSGTAPGLTDGGLGGREQLALANEMEALSFVAEKTGGVAAAGAGSVRSFVERVSADLSSWYSIGYPSPAGASRTAPVSVRVKGRPVTVRSRSALVGKSLEEQMKDRVLAHLFRADGRAKIPISVLASPAPERNGRHRIRLAVRIPISSLVLLPTAAGAAGSFSVFVASVAPEGDFSEVARRSQAFEIPAKELETAKAGHYTYEVEIETSGPEARVCVGIWDEKGNEAGFAVVTSTAPGAPTALPSAG